LVFVLLCIVIVLQVDRQQCLFATDSVEQRRVRPVQNRRDSLFVFFGDGRCGIIDGKLQEKGTEIRTLEKRQKYCKAIKEKED
jgi:hypothetical protein